MEATVWSTAAKSIKQRRTQVKILWIEFNLQKPQKFLPVLSPATELPYTCTSKRLRAKYFVDKISWGPFSWFKAPTKITTHEIYVELSLSWV